MKIHLRALGVVLVLLGVLLGLIVRAGRPPAPKGVEAPSDQFSAGRACAVLQDLLAEGVPHPVGSPANARVRHRIVGKLRGMGYEADVQQAAVRPGRPLENIVTRLSGLQPGPAVMLAAHYDSVAAGPGAADDGAGVAVVLELARMLKDGPPPRNTVVFLITDGEESGMWGAEAFVHGHPWAHQIGAVVNLEARGTSGRSLMFETSNNNAWLIAAYAAAVARPDTSSLYFEIYRYLPNDTDLTIFKRAGMAGVNFAFIGNAQRYHTAHDDLAHLDLGSLQHQGDNALAMVQALAAMDLSHPPPGNAVYVDLLGLTVVRWPERWGVPLAALSSLLVAAAVFGLVRSAAMSWRALACGLAAWPVLVAVPVLLGAATMWLWVRLTGSLPRWSADPAPLRVALWAEVIMAVVGLTALGGRWTGCWGLWSGTWIWWSIATLAVSALLPGAGFLFLIPLAAAGITCVAVRLTRLKDRPLARQAAIAIAALATGLLWMRVAVAMEDAMGLAFTPGITAPLALVMAAMAPAWIRSNPKT